MKFVTVATRSDGYFEYLKQSCVRHHIDIHVLGWGEEFQGWVWRLNLIRDYYNTLDPEDIVCFVDAYDVIILRDGTEIEKTFKNMNSRIVIAEDVNVNPIKEIIARFLYFGTCKNVRVNAGTYIGYVKDILWMLNSICILNDCDNDKKLDDQKMITDLCQHMPLRFTIDTDKDIFICTSYKSGMEMANISIDKQKVLYYEKTATPCILHGAGKASINDIISRLGYSINTKNESKNSEPYYQVLLGFISAMIIIVFGVCLYFITRYFPSIN
jgi:hypothetical protein